jgi:hypothetical protein
MNSMQPKPTAIDSAPLVGHLGTQLLVHHLRTERRRRDLIPVARSDTHRGHSPHGLGGSVVRLVARNGTEVYRVPWQSVVDKRGCGCAIPHFSDVSVDRDG